MIRTLKHAFLKFTGFSLLIMGIFIFIIGIAMSVDKDSEQSKNGIPIAIASTAFMISGAILILLAKRIKNENDMVETAASVIKSHRRIKLIDLSQQMNVPLPDASRYLSKALSLGLIKGFFDRTTDEFFIEGTKIENVQYKFCPSCGSPLEKIFLEGETIKCSRCGILIQ